MGRPLNKKYFGNRNIGTGGNQTTQHSGNVADNVTDGDDHIGGEGIADVAFGTSVPDTSYGSGAYLDRMPVVVSINPPIIANGVQAVASVTNVNAVHGVVHTDGTGGNDYLTGDILTLVGGTSTVAATFTVGDLEVSGVTIVTGNDGNTSHGYAVGDQLNFANGVVLTVATINGSGYPGGLGVVTSVTITNRGTYNGTTPPTGTVGHTNTLGGRGFTCNFTWGVKNVTVLISGDYTAVPGPAATTTVTHANLSASTATGCTLDVYWGIKKVTVSEKGSGYTGRESITFSATVDGNNETRAQGTIVLTQDTGAVGSATNQENAIIAWALFDGAQQEADIVRQVSTDRYRINVNETGNLDKPFITAKLKVTGLPSVEGPDLGGNMYKTEMNIWAFDHSGDSYLVKKLTARKAVVYPYACVRLGTNAGSAFAAGTAVPWNFFEGQPFADVGYVKIENA